jgi:hypothetical protein
MFHLDVLKIDLVLHIFQWLYTHVLIISSVVRCMLQMFHLNVSKVNLMLQTAASHVAAGVPLWFTYRRLRPRLYSTHPRAKQVGIVRGFGAAAG